MVLHPDLRVSDEDRDATVELLGDHLMAGRLDPDEHEERVEEACRARYGRDLAHALRELPQPPEAVPAAPAGPPVFVRRRADSRPGTALALGLTGLGTLLFTAGIAVFVALPLGLLAWGIGARAARQPAEVVGLTGRSTARTGMWLGVVTTTLSLLVILVVLVFAVGVGAIVGT